MVEYLIPKEDESKRRRITLSTNKELYRTEELNAIDTSNNRKRLKVRLNEAKSNLPEEKRKLFRHGKYVFEEKRLYSDDGSQALEWRLRRDPDRPISPRNPQSSRGDVELIDVSASED